MQVIATENIFVHMQGKLSDTYGRKKLLLLSCIGPFLGYSVIGLSKSLVLLIISRILHGIYYFTFIISYYVLARLSLSCIISITHQDFSSMDYQ